MLPILAFAFSLLADPVPPRQHLVQVELCQGDPFGSRAAGTIEVVSRPALVLADKQQGFCEVRQGGAVVNGVRYARGSGLVVRVRVETLGANKVRLAGTVETVEVDRNGPADDLVETARRARFLRDAFVGETVRVLVSKDGGRETWADLTVREPVAFNVHRMPAPARKTPAVAVERVAYVASPLMPVTAPAHTADFRGDAWKVWTIRRQQPDAAVFGKPAPVNAEAKQWPFFGPTIPPAK